MQRQQLRLREAAAQIRPSSVSQLLKNESRQMQMMGNRLQPALVRQITSATQTLNIAVASLRAMPLIDRTKRLRRDLNDSGLDLRKNFDRLIMELRSLLGAADRLHETLGYRETLKRGYAVVRSDASLITGVADAKLAKILEIEFIDGHLPVSPTSILDGSKAKKSKPPEQGQLL
jgi:exodeoxyribonuclease VII large subunit